LECVSSRSAAANSIKYFVQCAVGLGCFSIRNTHIRIAKHKRAPRKISAYGMMIGVHGRGTARLFDPRPLIEAV
jgi:hypothetical protein